MRRKITMLIMAAMLALTMAFGGGAGASFAAQCGTNGGPGCFEQDSPKNNPKFVTYARGNGGGGGADSQDCSVNPSGNKCR